MTKKSFKGGLSSLLENDEPIQDIKPAKQKAKEQHPEEVRATFILSIKQLETMKAMAFWERKMQKDVLDDALKYYFSSKDPELIDNIVKEYRKTKKHHIPDITHIT